MKVLLLNYNDTKGGAAIATLRIHKSLLKLGVDSNLHVYRKFSNEYNVHGPNNLFAKIYRILRQRFGAWLQFPFNKSKGVLNSASFLRTNLSDFINNSDYDIVHLNWINFDFISIEDISKINKPIIWTLHDMWAFCGAEHLSWDHQYINGYEDNFLLYDYININLNSLVWNRKKKNWVKPFQIVTPSKWLSDCVKNSKLMNNWPTTVINNPIDTEIWKNIGIENARKKNGFNIIDKIILFSTSESLNDYNKGFDILIKALSKINNPNIILLIIGAKKSGLQLELPFNLIFLGKIKDYNKLIEYYSCSNLVVIPSRLESLSYVAIEALSCSCPVVAFDNSGIADVIKHMHNGYLAKAFDINDFSNGIDLILNDENLAKNLSINAREFSKKYLDQDVIASKYFDLYNTIIKKY